MAIGRQNIGFGTIAQVGGAFAQLQRSYITLREFIMWIIGVYVACHNDMVLGGVDTTFLGGIEGII